MIQKNLIVFFLLLTNTIYCQNKSKVNIFLDENLNVINEERFNQKQESFLYFSQQFINDTLTVHRIFDIMKFGKFDTAENAQIRMLLERDSRQQDLKDQQLILTFRDTLSGFDNHLKNYKPTALTKAPTKLFVKEKIKTYDKNQQKCIKKDLKNNYRRLYLYNVNKGYDYNPEHFTWHKSSPVLRQILFDNRPSMLILKPNGEYFYFAEVLEKLVIEVLESDNWMPFINDYKTAKSTLAPTPFGNLKSISAKKNHFYYYSAKRRNCYYFGDY